MKKNLPLGSLIQTCFTFFSLVSKCAENEQLPSEISIWCVKQVSDERAVQQQPRNKTVWSHFDQTLNFSCSSDVLFIRALSVSAWILFYFILFIHFNLDFQSDETKTSEQLPMVMFFHMVYGVWHVVAVLNRFSCTMYTSLWLSLFCILYCLLKICFFFIPRTCWNSVSDLAHTHTHILSATATEH